MMRLLVLVAALLSVASAEKKDTSGVKTGLPGLTPAKKATAAVKAGAKAEKAGAAPGSVPAAHYMEFRQKLQASYCPKADAADKATLACKSFSLTKQIKAATSEEEKKKLTERKTKMYQDEGRKNDAEKKTATQAAKALYTKAYAKYCVESKVQTDEVCTNSIMKKMYGGGKPSLLASAAALVSKSVG